MKKSLITFAPAEDRTCDPPHVKQMLYHVAIKAGLYKCAIYLTLLHIPPPFLNSSPNLNLSSHEPIADMDVLRAHQTGYLCWVPDITGEKILITFAPAEESNPQPLTCEPNTLLSCSKARQYKCVLYTY